MIRPANLFDLTDLGLFCLECQESMPWARHGLTMSTADVMSRLLHFMVSPLCDLAVVDLGEGVSGACAVSVAPNALNGRQLMAAECMWHMRPNFPDGLMKRKWVIRMLDHMLAFSREAGAHVFKASTFHGDASLVALLARRGIRPMETACIGRL